MTPDEIWDEHRWEDFLRENDVRFDRFMNDVYEFMRLQPPPSEQDQAAYRLWKDDLKSFLRARGWRHTGFLAPDFDTEATGLSGILSDDASLDEEAEEEAEVAHPAIYTASLRLGTRVMQWANGLPGFLKDSALVQFCSSVMEIGAGVARGHALGYEQDGLGGNIAWAKRGLNAANAALDCLHEMKQAPYMSPDLYAALYEQTYEVRNSLALHVQDLRERFQLGVD